MFYTSDMKGNNVDQSATEYGDLPISNPEQDLFGIDTFAQSLASSIRKMASPEGVVIALNGVWGSGKSSAVNLVKFHLTSAVGTGEIELITFNPWWFRGEDALVLAFFRELHAATKPSLATKAKTALPKLGARLMKAGGLVGAAADAAGAGGIGKIAASSLDWLSGLIEDGESVEALHRQMAAALKSQKKRFVVLIDDIDRLAPDEALAMFRMVKSVGRLPNVIYLLAFDRILADRVVADQYPSEGPHYLEKIIQVAFDLPAPEPGELQEQLVSRIGSVCGVAPESEIVETMNLFYEIVAPEIRTPRDVFRLINALSVTWPAVAGEVYMGDFVAIEAIRLFQPSLYQAIRSNPDLLCGGSRSGERLAPDAGERLDALLLAGSSDKERHRRGLMRLFPKLESVWSNVFHTVGREEAKARRICVKTHFGTYFRFSIGDAVISHEEIALIIERADDETFIREKLRQAVQTGGKNGTRAALLLDTLIENADDIPLSKAASFLRGVFGVADDLNVEADHARGFSFGDNRIRVYWLMRELLFARTTREERSPIIMEAAKEASLGWIVYLARAAWDDYHPREGKEIEVAENCPVTLNDARKLKSMALAAIKAAAKDGTLVRNEGLASILYNWLDFARNGAKAVREWTGRVLDSDTGVAQLARGFTSYSWSQGMGLNGLGDLVAKRSSRANVQSLHEVMDQDRFRARLEELAKQADVPAEDAAAIRTFLDGWLHQEKFGVR
jgi:predicted KAP-like P-loop ATPase